MSYVMSVSIYPRLMSGLLSHAGTPRMGISACEANKNVTSANWKPLMPRPYRVRQKVCRFFRRPCARHARFRPFWGKVQTVSQPMWNPQMGGFPQSEEIRPQYFPTYFIYFFMKFQRYIGWRYILTMFFAGLGMYAYLRQIDMGRRTALWVGLAYMSAPTFLAFPMAGQYAKMGVIALFPWMMLFLERVLSQVAQVGDLLSAEVGELFLEPLAAEAQAGQPLGQGRQRRRRRGRRRRRCRRSKADIGAAASRRVDCCPDYVSIARHDRTIICIVGYSL